jgi:hypothetical protein
VARFSPTRQHFGKRPDTVEEDNGDGLPTPAIIKLKARRILGIKEAAATLSRLPEPGESLHALCTARMDLSDVIGALIGRLGRVEVLYIATLGYNDQNLRAMLSWLDQRGAGSITLLASIFFRSHKGELWEETLREFRERKQRAACCHSHAKVVAMHFASGTKLSIEGSANLCGNGSGREQFALINDAGLHDWHAAWIEELVKQHG